MADIAPEDIRGHAAVGRFAPITTEQAWEIAHEWRYPEPYNFYDADADPEDFAELLDPRQWPEVFEAYMVGDMMIGFYTATISHEAAEIGLGLRPDHSGKGIGQQFVEAIARQLTTKHPSLSTITLSVAAFNHRAITVYTRAGFTTVGMHLQETNGGNHRFVDMVLDTTTLS